MSGSVTIKFKTKKALKSLVETRGYEETERATYKTLSLFKKMCFKKLNPTWYEYIKNTESVFTENTHTITGEMFYREDLRHSFLKNLKATLKEDKLIYSLDYEVKFDDN